MEKVSAIVHSNCKETDSQRVFFWLCRDRNCQISRQLHFGLNAFVALAIGDSMGLFPIRYQG